MIAPGVGGVFVHFTDIRKTQLCGVQCELPFSGFPCVLLEAALGRHVVIPEHLCGPHRHVKLTRHQRQSVQPAPLQVNLIDVDPVLPKGVPEGVVGRCHLFGLIARRQSEAEFEIIPEGHSGAHPQSIAQPAHIVARVRAVRLDPPVVKIVEPVLHVAVFVPQPQVAKKGQLLGKLRDPDLVPALLFLILLHVSLDILGLLLSQDALFHQFVQQCFHLLRRSRLGQAQEPDCDSSQRELLHATPLFMMARTAFPVWATPVAVNWRQSRLVAMQYNPCVMMSVLLLVAALCQSPGRPAPVGRILAPWSLSMANRRQR